MKYAALSTRCALKVRAARSDRQGERTNRERGEGGEREGERDRQTDKQRNRQTAVDKCSEQVKMAKV